MTDAPLRILLVEDSPLDAELTGAALDDAGVAHAIQRVDTADGFAAGLDADPDLILSDYLLPTFDGAAALRMARQRRPDVPFIFLSGALGEELAIESLKDGATDYVLKQRLGRLAPAVRRAVREAADRRLRGQVEEQYRFLADAVPQIVWTCRPDGAVEYCNARWHQFTGLAVDQLSGTDWLSTLHPEDVPAVRAAWLAARATVRPFEVEHRLRRHDGDYRWHLSRAVPRVDGAGQVVQWVGSATDIDDRRRVEAEHRRLLGQLDAIIGHMNEGLIVADGDGHVLSINAAGLRLYGLPDVAEFRRPLHELTGRVHFAAPDGTSVPIDRWPLSRAIAGQTYADYVLQVHRPTTDGQPWVANYAGTGIRGPDGRVTIAIVTFRDVTAQTRADAELARAKRDADDAREAAEAANRSKDEFLATLSHELRTPLNAILGWAQLLRADVASGPADPTDLQQGLATIERNARVQAQLIEDLLDVSRIVSGHLRLNPQPTDLRAIVAAAVDGVRPAADAKPVMLHLPVDGGPAALVGDPDRLQQVVWNLLNNAVKFTPAGGSVNVAISGGQGDGWELTVTDTGQGIAANFLPYVFDRFRQADGTASRKHGGLGLGLAIVKHLVEQHGGTASAHSDGIGRGATFTIRLPAGTGADRVDVGPPKAGPASLQGVSVVVVDDEPDARSLASIVLARAGATVTPAGSLSEALRAVAAVRPAVLVSDIAMPGGDGYSLIDAVRQLPAGDGGRTPAVALTAFARPEDRDRALTAGFDAHLPKPLDAAALVATVARLATREDPL